MGAYIFGSILGIVIMSCIWGYVVNKMIEYKGIQENWFWWGFFFGIFAALLALAKPWENMKVDSAPNSYDMHKQPIPTSTPVDMNNSSQSQVMPSTPLKKIEQTNNRYAVSSDETIACPYCGTVQKADRTVCFNCGMSFKG